jgi:hypothetical protein
MIKLRPIIDCINNLLAEDTEASITYAALEARLALEKVCYDRLRQRHDYISHDQLKKWQPGAVVNTLMNEVDPHVAQTFTLSISKNPAQPGIKPEDEEYVPVGTEVGFDPKYIAKLWNALAGLALHVRLPKNQQDYIPSYGNKVEIVNKVTEVVAELERLATGTISSSGFGKVVSFDCNCGEKNKRRVAVLREGQLVSCINPDCPESWQVSKDENGEFWFETKAVPVDCGNCGQENLMRHRHIMAMKTNERILMHCRHCNAEHYIQWRLMQALRPNLENTDIT